ncbi:MAG: hypothetical protein ABW170_04495 [Candidatus Thiodiazotropha sp. L084R]
MTRTAGALIGRRRSSAFWGLGCPKTHHEIKDSLDDAINLWSHFGNGERTYPSGQFCAHDDALRFQHQDIYSLWWSLRGLNFSIHHRI